MPLALPHQFPGNGPDKLGPGPNTFDPLTGSTGSSVAKYGVLGAVFEMLEPVMMRSSPLIFETAIERRLLERFWVWLERDGAPNLVEALKAKSLEMPLEINRLVATAFREMVEPLEQHYALALKNTEAQRRLTIQLGGFEVYEAYPVILTAIRHYAQLQAAKELAAHISQYDTEEEYSEVVGAIELPVGAGQKLWCTALVHNMVWPGKFMMGVLAHCYGDTEQTVRKSGYGPYGDAMVVNLQQLTDTIEEQAGVFSDVDLMCLAIDRFHRIARILHSYLDLGKSSQWNHCIEILTVRVAKALEKRLSVVVPNVTKVLRTPTESAQALFTTDQVLQAYNGVYLLDAARHAKESLAVNSIVDRTWNELGKSLEILLERSLEDQKAAVFGDTLALAKVDIAIKLSAIRFGAEYAQIMTKNKDNIERRKLIAKHD